MLSERCRELLSAAIDGELSSAEGKQVRRMLRDSEEARSFFADLTRQAERLRGLPRACPSIDLSKSVLQQIFDQSLTPTPLPTVRPKPFPLALNHPSLWAGVAGISVMLFAVCGMSYFFFLSNQASHRSPESPLVEKKSPTRPGPSSTDRGTGKKTPEPETPETPEVLVKETPEPEPEEQLPFPREVPGNSGVLASLTSPSPELFDLSKIRLSLILSLKELDQAYPKQKLREEITRDEVIHLDLFCRDSVRGVETLQAAFRGRGHTLLIDATVAERLKKKQATEFMFYTESMSAEEVAAMLDALGADDRKLEVKKSGDGQFDKFVLAPFQPVDLNKLAQLLGTTVQNLKLNKPKTALDPRKPLSEVTATQLTTTLPKSSGTAPAAKAAEKLTLIVPYSPANPNPAASKEVKSFFEKRGERKPGTTPLMLVLRMVNA